jgi:DNA-binding CsgD family transcriptional regulator
MSAPDSAHPLELLRSTRAVMEHSLLEVAGALSAVLAPLVAHSALVIFTEDCTGRPQKKAGLPAITETVTIAELDVLRDAVTDAPRLLDDAVIGGTRRPALVWPSHTGAILVLVHPASADDDALAGIDAVFQLVALSIRQQVANAAPSYLSDSRAASSDRAGLIADLTDAHATALESLLVVLRSRRHSDAAARQSAIDVAAAAMVRLRSVSDRDRLLAEEPVHTAFERLRDDLGPLVRHGELDVEFVAPPLSGRPLPGEVAHAARAVVRGAVLALVERTAVSRVRIQWDCDGSNLLIGIRDNGEGDLDAEIPSIRQLVARVTVLDGTFDVEATAGWGSEMRIVLPLDAVPAPLSLSQFGQLTAREREVLDLLVEGKRNKAIAAGLTISENTVKFHVANILRKVGTSSRAELAALAAAS